MDAQSFFFLDPAFVLLLAVLAGAIWFGVAARRRAAAGPLSAIGALDFFCGAIIAALGAAHLIAVVGRALAGEGGGAGGRFAYDFRFYSLVLLGVLLIAGGMAALLQASGLTRGDRTSWKAAVWASSTLFVLNVPLMPIQGFAVGFSVFALANLLALVVTRRRFHASTGAAAV